MSKINFWSDERKGTIGNIYQYSNPYSGTQDYFVLLTSAYCSHPTNQTSNREWKYLGSADGSINFKPLKVSLSSSDC